MVRRLMDRGFRILHESTVVRLAVLVGIPSFAFVIRAAWLIKAGSGWALGPDSVQYVALSNGLSHGCGFAYWLGGFCGRPDVFRTPLYPAFLTIFGGAWRLAVACQALLGALTCAAVAAFVCDRYGVVPAAFAAGVVATDVPSIFSTRLLMADPLCQFTLTAGVLLCVSGYCPTPRTRSPLLRVASGGIFVALAVLARPAAVSALPILALPPLLLKSSSGSKRIRVASLGLLLPAALLSAWVLRNYRATGLATLSTAGAVALYSSAARVVMSRATGTSLATTSLALASVLKIPAGTAVAKCPGVCGCDQLYDLAMCGVTADPTLSRTMLQRTDSAMWEYPVESVLLTLEGFIRLCIWPHIPGVPDVLPNMQSTLFEWRLKPSLVDFAVWLTTAFEIAVLFLIWAGVAKAVYQGFSIGARSDGAILIWSLLGVGLLLLVPPSLLFYNWQTRYRCLAIPFLAIVAATGWFRGAWDAEASVYANDSCANTSALRRN